MIKIKPATDLAHVRCGRLAGSLQLFHHSVTAQVLLHSAVPVPVLPARE